MKGRGITVWLGLAAALGVALVWSWREPPPEARAPGLLEVEREAIAEVVLERPEGRMRLSRRGDRWEIVEPSAMDADPDAVARWLGQVTAIRVRRLIAGPGEEAGAYGLASPARTLELRSPAGAVLASLAVGRSSPVGDERFAREGDGPVVLVDGSVARALAVEVGDLGERRAIPLAPDRIVRLRIEGPSGVASFQRGREGAWRMLEPWRTDSDAAGIASLARKLAALRVDGDFVPAIRGAPRFRVEAESAEGRAHAVDLIPVGEGARLAVRRDGASPCGTIASADASFLERRPGEWIDRRVAPIEPAAVRAVRLDAGGKRARLAREESGPGWSRSLPGGGRADTAASEVEALLARLARLRAERVDAAPFDGAHLVFALEGRAGDLGRVEIGSVIGDGTAPVRSSWRPGLPGLAVAEDEIAALARAAGRMVEAGEAP